MKKGNNENKAAARDAIFAGGIFAQGYGFSPKVVMKDTRLTIEAKAIYAYLSSYSGAGMSSFPSAELICHELGITRQRYARHRALLIECGYLRVTQSRAENGFSKNIFELVVDIDNVGLQNVPTQNVASQNITHNSNNLKSNNSNKEDTPQKSQSIDAAFDIYWQAGMRKVGKKNALQAFKAAVRDGKHDPVEFATMLATDVKNRLGKQFGFDSMHPTTYLRNERWADELEQQGGGGAIATTGDWV